MRAAILACALLGALFGSGETFARDQFGARDEIVIDPARSYIFYRTDVRLDVQLLREVDEAEQAAWEADRAQALERAQSRYERSIARWRQDEPRCRGRGAASGYCQARGPMPMPVTDENFAFPPPEADNFVAVGGGRYFSRDNGSYAYLRAVEPGTYILYGSAGVCLCMGSIRFETRPGEIVDLGALSLASTEGEKPQGRFIANGRLPSPSVTPPVANAPRPERLANARFVAADLRAADRMPNYFGVLIDRLAPMPGILAYDRDEVIDLKAQTTEAVVPEAESAI
jgi:hypothetical protein